MLDVTGAREDAYLEAQEYFAHREAREYEDYYNMVPVKLEAPATGVTSGACSGETAPFTEEVEIGEAGASIDTLREQVELGNLIWHTVHGEPR